ncbi:MAG: peptidoglycan-binding protein [Polyangiaceae bacterium]|nr:peptidoglycan-binding protein [Polyangiaceae bacterium]
MGMRPYVIRQGDYLSRLAFRFGFKADDVWNASENEGLRRIRSNPEMLAPGDVLQIPDTPERGPSVRIGGNNRYKAEVPKVQVSLHLTDEGRAMANEPYRVEGLARPITGQSNGEGRVEFEVPVTSREVMVHLPNRHTSVPVRVGDLDPPNTESGVLQRLDHLGYYRPNSESPDEGQNAIRRFQRDRGLPDTGELNEATRNAIMEAHES